MLISQLSELLKEFQDQHGDVEVFVDGKPIKPWLDERRRIGKESQCDICPREAEDVDPEQLEESTVRVEG